MTGRSVVAIIQGNFVGLDPDYRDPRGTGTLNNAAGIFLNDTAGVLIGGLTARPGTGVGNVISGNEGPGIQIAGVANPSDAGNLVLGNILGLDPTGLQAVALTGNAAESRSGISVIDSAGNLIGGPWPGAGNVISGHDFAGISIFGNNAVRNVIQGNTIGGTILGTPLTVVPQATSNPSQFQDVGVLINAIGGNVIGGPIAAASNTLIGNLAGVELVGIDPLSLTTANYQGNTVQGNLVAGNATGLYLNATTGHLLLSNRVIQNSTIGISIVRPNSQRNIVQGNTIADTGTPNTSGTGLYIEQAQFNTIGLTPRTGGQRSPAAAGLGNLFVGNGSVDLYMFNGATGNSVRGNTFQGRTSAYGILLYNSPNNLNDVILPGQGPDANRLPPFGRGPTIANFRNFNSAIDAGQPGTGRQRQARTLIAQSATPHGPAGRFRSGRLG